MMPWVIAMSVFGGVFIGTSILATEKNRLIDGIIGSWLLTIATITLIAEKVIQ
jgi:hypothetical protein